MHELTNDGLRHELNFWQGFIKSDRFLREWLPDNVVPSDLTQPARDWIAKIAPYHATVLDVGSGVVSILRGTIDEAKLACADPLANHYMKIFDYIGHGITPPYPIAAEDIDHEDRFDLVHISNALDHTINPVTAYENMLRAVKPGGHLMVQGFVDEGKFEGWKGLHQWNLSITEQGHLFIANRQGGGVTIGRHKVHAEAFKLVTGKTWMIWIAQKP